MEPNTDYDMIIDRGYRTQRAILCNLLTWNLEPELKNGVSCFYPNVMAKLKSGHFNTKTN